MAKAISVLDVERENAEWLSIEADDGRVYRYQRLKAGNPATAAHVESEYIPDGRIRARVAKDKDGHPLLSQAGNGLPASIVVNVISDVSSTGVVVVSHWSGLVEYALVSADFRFKPGDTVRHRTKGLVGAVISVEEGEGNVFAENLTYTVKWTGSFPPESMISWKELDTAPTKVSTAAVSTGRT